MFHNDPFNGRLLASASCFWHIIPLRESSIYNCISLYTNITHHNVKKNCEQFEIQAKYNRTQKAL